MSAVIETESAEHRRLVKALIDYIARQGFDVTNASFYGYPECPEIEGRIPDVRASNLQQLLAIGEVKTPDQLQSERTIDQFKLFSNLTVGGGLSNGTVVPFYIAITAGHEEEVSAVLVQLGINGKPNIHIVGL